MNSTSLTLYDFLNYEVIGAFMLLACNVSPNTIDSWMFFVCAFMVGLIVSKLNEESIWGRCSRNPKCLIKKAKEKLEKTKDDAEKNKYYEAYYRVLGDKVKDSIRILEAHFAFVRNLIVVDIVYFMLYMCRGKEFIPVLTAKRSLFCCCQNTPISDNIQISICPLIVTVLILLLGVVAQIAKEIGKSECSITMSIPMEGICWILFIIFCLLLLVIPLGFMYSLCSRECCIGCHRLFEQR